MENSFVELPRDLNRVNPAKRHQEDARKRAQEDDEVPDPSRRSFLRAVVEGAAVGIAAVGAVKGMTKLSDAYSEYSKKNEENLRRENPVASEIEDKLDFISAEMDNIKGETVANPLGIGVINRSERFQEFKEEFDFLKEEGKKIRARKDSIPESVMFSRLEELEKEVSMEALKLKHKI